MKKDLIKILNDEIAQTQRKIELGIRNQNLERTLMWKEIKTILERILMRIQDEG